MSVEHTVAEFRTHWLPNITDDGLTRLIHLLDTASPLLIHGAFTRACAMGCLATHIGWHHPATRDLNDEAGVSWLTQVAKLNPATSRVILAWDRCGESDWELRAELLKVCRDEQSEREVDSWAGTGVAYNGMSVTPGMRPAAWDA